MATRDIKLAQAIDAATGGHHVAAFKNIAQNHALRVGYGKSSQLHIMQMSADTCLYVWQAQAGCGVAAFPAELQPPLRVRCDLSLFLHYSFRMVHFDWMRIEESYAVTPDTYKELVREATEVVMKLNARLTPTVWNKQCYPLTT